MSVGRFVLLGILASGLIGCGRTSALHDQWQTSDYHLSMQERLRRESVAPVIVLARVTAVTNIGQPERSLVDYRVSTQLVSVKIFIEHVIKGKILENPIQFYFFQYWKGSAVGLGVPTYTPKVGQRRIYFLKPWGETYRSVGDVLSYNLEIWSGTHKAGLCDGTVPGCCISALLLTPADGADMKRFTGSLWPTAYASSILCSPVNTKRLLVPLVRSSDPSVAAAAADSLQALEQWWPQLRVSH